MLHRGLRANVGMDVDQGTAMSGEEKTIGAQNKSVDHYGSPAADGG